MTTALLQTTYFGPIQWYQKLYRYDHCLIEQYDSYQKQTYRNRCIIATANGVQTLTVPVESNKREVISVWSKTYALATITNGEGCIGMPCKVPIVRVLSSTIMRTTSVPSSSRDTNFWSISTRPSDRKCANSSTSTPLWNTPRHTHQPSAIRPQTS